MTPPASRLPEVVSLLSAIPDDLPEERFETLLEGSSFTLERILSRGHVTAEGAWYDQERDEWVLVLRGRGKLLFDDGSERHLEAGDCLFIPAHRRHRVVFTDPEHTTIWLALHCVADRDPRCAP